MERRSGQEGRKWWAPDTRIPAKAGNDLFSHIFQDQYQDHRGVDHDGEYRFSARVFWGSASRTSAGHGSDSSYVGSFFFFFFLADRIDQWDDGPGAEGTLTTYRPLQASFFFFSFFTTLVAGCIAACASLWADNLILSLSETEFRGV